MSATNNRTTDETAIRDLVENWARIDEIDDVRELLQLFAR
jgi:hypothetical protein